MGTLYLVATPIGNLEDISQRALRVLRDVHLIAAEDTRHSRKLLDRYQISTPVLSYHEHNKLVRVNRLLDELERGDVAMVSDAGTPGLSDPGYRMVAAALNAGHEVSPIPGPSAPIAALVASGLPTDAFVFLGYLPRRASDRRRLLMDLADERRTMLAFEVPHRLVRSLDDLIAAFGPQRQVAVCRELTKIHEQILRGSLADMLEHFSAVEPHGEFTLVVRGAQDAPAWDEKAVRAEVARRLEQGLSPSEVAREVALEAGWRRRDVYRLIMEDK